MFDVDLHVHSTVSDGTMSPAEVVKHAASKGIRYMALTDHDTVDGVEEALTEAEKSGITVIPGVELSVSYLHREVHILGYYLNHKADKLAKFLENMKLSRVNRNLEMIELFNRNGIPVTIKDLEDYKSPVITRAHYAQYLIKNGYCKNMDDAFKKYLSDGGLCFVPRKTVTPKEAMKVITENGGVPVLAHPMLYKFDLKTIDIMVSELKEMGLTGIETYYSCNISNDEDVVRHLALKYNLIMTGGSDFHGKNKPDIEIGTGRGNLKIPHEAYESLREAYYQVKNEESKVKTEHL